MADAVASGATVALAAIERSRAMADAERQAAERASHGRDGELKAVRARIRELADRSRATVSTAHGAEMERATRRMKLEQVAARAAEEFAIDTDALIAEYGPDVEHPRPPRRASCRRPTTGPSRRSGPSPRSACSISWAR